MRTPSSQSLLPASCNFLRLSFGDLGTHSLDILMWLFGPVESVSAEVRVVTGRYPGCDETGTDVTRAWATL